MGYQEAFRDVVLKPLREDEEVNQEVNQYLAAYQQNIAKVKVSRTHLPGSLQRMVRRIGLHITQSTF